MASELLISAKPSKRIGALLLDLLINAAVAAILLIPSILALTNVFLNKSDANIIALFIASLGCGALIVSFAIFYFVCLPSIWEGQTIGKRVAKIRVIDINTNEGPNARTMFLRESSRILIFITSFGLVNFSFYLRIIVNLHLGKLEQLINSPNLPSLLIRADPHLGHLSTSLKSIFIPFL